MGTQRLVAGMASFSWINPITGLPEVDKGGEPGQSIGIAEVFAGKKYRFSNYLEAVVDVDDRNGITKATFGLQSGMYRGPSFLGLDSAPVGSIGRSVSFIRQEAVYRQIVGCRTESPEKIGAGGGAVVGAAAGGALAGVWLGPVGMFIGAVALGTVGYFSGREVAEFASAFPPIWTELELAIKADGSVRCALVSHSLFPSHTIYRPDPARATATAGSSLRQQDATYDGDATRLKKWKAQGWGLTPAKRSGPTAGNPWGMEDPGPEVRLGGASVKREMPSGY